MIPDTTTTHTARPTSAPDGELVTTLPTTRFVGLRRFALPVLIILVVLAALILVVRVGTADNSSDQAQTAALAPPADATAANTTAPGTTTPASSATPTTAADPQPTEPAIDPDPASALPVGTTRFVPVTGDPVVDTRAGRPQAPGNRLIVEIGDVVSPDASAVMLAVNVIGASTEGPVELKFDQGPVTVDDIGPMLSELLIVPRRSATDLVITNSAGGHVVVNVVGQFVASGPTTAGRFIPVAPTTIGTLVTAVEGRSATFGTAELGLLPERGVGQVLVRIRADVGDQGGVVRVGSAPDNLTGQLMWGPTTGADRTRMGLAVVSPDQLGQWSLEYNGGSELAADLLGYFTDDQAETSTAGLFVPLPSTRFTADDLGVLVPDGTTVSAAAVTVDRGRTRAAVITPTDQDGRIAIPSDPAVELVLETTGYFLADSG